LVGYKRTGKGREEENKGKTWEEMHVMIAERNKERLKLASMEARKMVKRGKTKR
jgi:hypothetical protein